MHHYAYSLLFLGICATVWMVVSSAPTAEAGVVGMEMAWMPLVEEESELEMDSEINRRILASKRYISYGAMRRDTVPCSRKGNSYYNCQPGAPANPYQRGCSAITRCRR
ncbi:protein RALF-like 33 [Vigna unguiculata]|uniref:Rapid ALkalinization Factor n=1 Tax=Vigna unguiculata TaxID=3917 RepID=A0A4D6NCN8_VIGUN|nr:protein RALF-like 33 [Vigna unguiculata]QCE11630.1 Rapid ALkalinization Factor [Vigna unguiculata]